MIRSGFAFLFLLIIFSCVDRIAIPIPSEFADDLVVDGLITDEQGPYTVYLSRVSKVDGQSKKGIAVSAVRVTISDNFGNSEILTENPLGTYKTKVGGIKGVIGREYTIMIETRDGKVYQSSPEKINPVSDIDNLYYQLETSNLGGVPKYGYRIYIESKALSNSENLMRWKLSGTYIVETFPELHTIRCGESVCPDPLPCSSYALDNGAVAVVVGKKCECCRCWVTDQEDKPKVGDTQFVLAAKSSTVEVGFVPIDYYRFFEKYRVEVKQMSISRPAYDFWRAVQLQKEGTGSLFQSPAGRTKGNLFEKSGASVQGIFYAAAVKSRQLYIRKQDVNVQIAVPINVAGPGKIPESCINAFEFSTNQQPSDWK